METPRYLITAEQIARELHAGQLYGDQDYVEAHVQPVAETIRRLGYGPVCQAAGWLHDTIEDTAATASFLLNSGIPDEVVHPVELLTKVPGQLPYVYLGKIAEHRVATVVKFVDSLRNLAWTALNSPDLKESRFRAWTLEYSANIAFLRHRLPDPF